MKSRNLSLALSIAVGAVIVSLDPALSRTAIYDRLAVLDGEIWRLFTAPLVHFTPTHLAYDTSALIFAASLIGWRGNRGFGWVCGITPLATGMAALAFEPQLAFYGGLSGVATAAVVLLALQGLHEPGASRSTCAGVLLAVAGKTWFETATGEFAFISRSSVQFKPASLCHVTGILAAAGVFAFQRFRARGRKPRAVHVINKSSCENAQPVIGKGHAFSKFFETFPRETHSSSIPLHVGSRSRRHGA